MQRIFVHLRNTEIRINGWGVRMHKIQENEWDTEPVLKVDIQQAGYEPGRPRIRDISFQVAPGELLGLIGPNGAGKSTTIKTVLGA